MAIYTASYFNMYFPPQVTISYIPQENNAFYFISLSPTLFCLEESVALFVWIYNKLFVSKYCSTKPVLSEVDFGVHYILSLSIDLSSA
jgi:hypothetical protein